ncbi:MAG TPA: hypothetical protein VFI02_05745, partial [Armatimonadota bacterium]|nr:hypothetical protein [Armatimonadota bacterium]
MDINDDIRATLIAVLGVGLLTPSRGVAHFLRITMNKSPAYQWYPDKAMLDMRRLTWEAKGVYRELLDVIWMQHQETCSIPDDDEYISSELGAPLELWQRAKAEIMLKHRPLLQVTETNRLFSNGLWKEREKQAKRREQLSENGRKGGRPQGSRNQKVIFEEPNDNQNESLPSPSPSPSPIPSPTLYIPTAPQSKPAPSPSQEKNLAQHKVAQSLSR